MSSITRNSLTLFVPTAGYVLGHTTQDTTGHTVTLDNQSGSTVQQSDVTLTRVSTGSYTIAVTNFQGPQGFFNAAFTVDTTTADCSVQAGGPSYSGRTLTVPFQTYTAGTIADCQVFFTIQAF